MNTNIDPNSFVKWEPRPGFLVLLPSRISNTVGEGAAKIFLPDSHTQKTNEGICIKAATKTDQEIFLGKECFFALHNEYKIEDSDTGYLVFVIDADKILMTREPPKDVLRHSIQKKEGMSFKTFESTQPTNL